ncbi:leukotriene-B4 omega-hydroxylase 3-like [Glandiceps talaboti]
MSAFLSSWREQVFAVLETNSPVYYVKLSSLTLLVITACLFIAKCVELVRRRWQAESDLSAFPTPPRHWLFGHIGLGNSSEEKFIVQETTLNGPYSPARVNWIGPFIAGVVCIHPSTVRCVLSTTEPKDEVMYGIIRTWLGDGLLVSKGKKWFRNRRLLTPGFHFDILKPYVKIFNQCALDLVDKWSAICKSSDSQDVPVEMFEHISLMTLDSLLKCIFSQDSHCQTQIKDIPYIEGVYTLSSLIVERIRFPPFYSDFIYQLSPSGRRFYKALKVVHRYSWKVIQERKAALVQEDGKTVNRKYVDFLDILLKARDEDNNGLTEQEIKDEVDTFLFEGHDTTASGISWCLYNLAKHPEHQDRCRQEVNDLLAGKDSQEIEWDDLNELRYLTLCIKESLRLNPPVPAISRLLTSPLTFPDGRTVPAGYRVTIQINNLHHNQLVWDDPCEYRPERFTPENTKGRSPYAYVPFAAGPRNCIGQNFAMNEMKVTIATILHHFQIDLDHQKPAPNRFISLVLRSKTGINLRITPCKSTCM